MKKFATLLALLAVVATASATDWAELGYTSEPGVVIPSSTDECTGALVVDHDGSFENGLTFWYTGVEPPYVGSFGESYVVDGNIQCIATWLTQTGTYAGQTMDVYIWEGGVSGLPDAVLQVDVGIDPGPPAMWPDISQHDADIVDYVASGEVTVGYWGNWPGAGNGWYCAMDTDGFGGYPWVFTADGWQTPLEIGYACQAFGLGYYFGEDPTPAASATWGSIKALFE